LDIECPIHNRKEGMKEGMKGGREECGEGGRRTRDISQKHTNAVY
jgi:hypothetical protein